MNPHFYSKIWLIQSSSWRVSQGFTGEECATGLAVGQKESSPASIVCARGSLGSHLI